MVTCDPENDADFRDGWFVISNAEFFQVLYVFGQIVLDETVELPNGLVVTQSLWTELRLFQLTMDDD